MWLQRGFWAITDQGLFATSNLILNIMLARWLTPEDYGVFALTFSLFLLVSTVHVALLTEPMLVFGPNRRFGSFQDYVGNLLIEHWKLSAVLSGVLALISLAFLASGARLISLAMFVLVVSSPFVLLQWFLRRACYMRREPRTAAMAGLAYAVFVLFGAWLLYANHLLSIVTVFVLMGVASVLVDYWLKIQLNTSLFQRSKNCDAHLIRQAHWSFGRWAIGNYVLSWFNINIFFFILPLWGGLSATGEFRALMNFALPIINLNAAIGPVLLTEFVTARGSYDLAFHIRFSRNVLVSFAAIYWFFLAVSGEYVVHILYSGKYAQLPSILVWFGLVFVTFNLTKISETGLLVMERPNLVFWSYSFSAIAAIALGFLLNARVGDVGAAMSYVVSSTVSAAATTLLLWSIRDSSNRDSC